MGIGNWMKLCVNCGGYVACSTLNQVVNYIPLKSILKNKGESDMPELFQITYKYGEEKKDKEKSSERFPNRDWDKCWSGVLSEKMSVYKVNEPEVIELNRVFDMGDYAAAIKKCLFKCKGKNIIWNVTGGQKSVLLAIYSCLMQLGEEDRALQTILYLEGNTHQMICGTYRREKMNWVFEQMDEEYGDEELDFDTAFRLFGYGLDRSTEIYELAAGVCLEDQIRDNEDSVNPGFYDKLGAALQFYDNYYSEASLDEALELVATNGKDREGVFDEIIDRLVREERLGKKEGGLISGLSPQNKLGYLLEYMVTGLLIREVEKLQKTKKNIFRCVLHNGKIKGYGSENKNKCYCEWDVALLTKSGQIVVIECKSGSMRSENAKSREYTAYSLAGVYGKPILVPALLENHIESYFNRTDLKQKDSPTFEALEAAKRAGLETWGLDSIVKGLRRMFCCI